MRLSNRWRMRITRARIGEGRIAVVDRWRRVAVHTDWVNDAKITESVYDDGSKRRFTATVLGWRNWKIWEGDCTDISVPLIIKNVENIRKRILAGDETVFARDANIVGSPDRDGNKRRLAMPCP